MASGSPNLQMAMTKYHMLTMKVMIVHASKYACGEARMATRQPRHDINIKNVGDTAVKSAGAGAAAAAEPVHS